MRSPMRLLLVAVAALLQSCSAPLPGTPCADDQDCPGELRCDAELALCYRPEAADAGAADRTSNDLDPGDRGPFDHDPDSGSADLSVPDLVVLDSWVADRDGIDQVAPDAARADVSLPDAAIADTATLDTLSSDASALDASAPDTAVPDLLTPDSTLPDGDLLDAAVHDSATRDAMIPDSAMPDTLIADVAVPDTADASVFCADGTVYADHCYVHPAATGANWREAFDYCQARGMHLVQVESDTERDFILSSLAPFHTNYIWIGLHDMTDEGSFTSMDGSAPTWTDWVNASEPNDRDNHGEGEDCVVMTANTGGWYDYTCRVPTASSDIVCELDPTAPPAICGDGVQGPGEACDDQNTSDGDECNAVCTVSCVGGVTWDLHCYRAGTRRDTWIEGGATCGGLGLGYASIGSPEEQQAMNDLRASGDLPQEDLWVGLSDMLATGWLWSSGEETLGYYVGWGSGEPDGTGQCVVVGMHGAETALWWHDADCTSSSHLPLCESE